MVVHHYKHCLFMYDCWTLIVLNLLLSKIRCMFVDLESIGWTLVGYSLTWVLWEEWNVVAWYLPYWAVVEAIAGVPPWSNYGSSHSISCNNCTIHCRVYTCPTAPTAPTGAFCPLLSIPSYYLLYISDEGVVGEEGCWGQDKGSGAICRAQQ